MQKAHLPADVFFQALTIKAIKQEEDHPHNIHAIASEDWRAPIFTYLTETFGARIQTRDRKNEFQNQVVYTRIWEEEYGNSKLPRLCHQGIDYIKVDIS